MEGSTTIEKQENTLLTLGKIIVDDNAKRAALDAHIPLADLLARHIRGDWGDIGGYAKQLNEYASQFGWRIQSSYRLDDTKTICIRTSPNRTMTEVTLIDDATRTQKVL